MHFLPALQLIFCFSLFAKIVLSQAASEDDNAFLFPPPYDPSNDVLEDNPVYVAGDRITIRWKTTFEEFKLYSVQGSESVSWSEDLKLESNSTNLPGATSYNWEVWTNIEDPPFLPLYLIIQNTQDTRQSFRTRSFNITNGPRPDQMPYTISEGGTSVKTTTRPRSTTSAGTGVEVTTMTTVPGRISTTSTVSESTAPAEAESNTGDNTGKRDNRALRLGLGIGLGLGLGIPFLIIMILLVPNAVIWILALLSEKVEDKKRDRKELSTSSIGGTQNEEAGDGKVVGGISASGGNP